MAMMERADLALIWDGLLLLVERMGGFWGQGKAWLREDEGMALRTGQCLSCLLN
jgi:hypothetical protein